VLLQYRERRYLLPQKSLQKCSSSSVFYSSSYWWKDAFVSP
jgi:hypothetical protein